MLIGYVGNIYPSDAELMAAAFNRVRTALPNSHLVLVGYFNRALEPLVDKSEYIIRSGRVGNEQMFQYLAACDVCWLPLRDNGTNRGRWPGKLNDYMTMARPVVATAVGDLAEVVKSQAIGSVAADNPDDFAQATIALLFDPAKRITLGQTARRVAEESFSWEHMTDRLEQLYRQTLNLSHRS
jgi:glycosyltransferase involved in cell wall biosynthesis